ncbi:hypothetical protein Apa02nite_091310 [Actinoplanes palleronii]|uniref:Uncharacterized protein n=1 Tax=Actinoplanes palleronii TaxID=113570 RepID=A0ABQ4BQT2_9ACTN|nr:hypothetical protein Apa02nite_091310 [Actinoplanes palleronii]
MNNSAACRGVGINRRTGIRWRYGRTVTSADNESRSYPPLAAPKRDVSVRYLSEDERITLADAVEAALRALRNHPRRSSPGARPGLGWVRRPSCMPWSTQC